MINKFMIRYKNIIFTILIVLFLLFSFYPTIFELSQKNKLKDPQREFILEHNYYWPDYNLYLSKIKQGLLGRFTAVEKYTSEIHQGSLIQEFYVVLGWLGKILNLTPNNTYLLGRIILSPLLLLIILKLVKYYFPSKQNGSMCHAELTLRHPELVSGSHGIPDQVRNDMVQDNKVWIWQILAFLITITSASFPRFFSDAQGITHIGRYMEWWSNIDALQRITFIPHILFGQVVSFYLLYKLVIDHSDLLVCPTRLGGAGRQCRSKIVINPSDSGVTDASQNDNHVIFNKKLMLLIFLGNSVGLTFPPSLITLDGVLILIALLSSRARQLAGVAIPQDINIPNGIASSRKSVTRNDRIIGLLDNRVIGLFVIGTLPSLLYVFLITKFTPWSALVIFHRTHPMMIPFDQYILGIGPIFFLGIIGAIVSIVKRERRFQPLIFWILATFSFAAFFSIIKEQSPLRFTQTGLFIPLGILGSYFFYQLFLIRPIRLICLIWISIFLLSNLFMMKTSLDWQTTWITQRLGANIPPVPYPPQAMYPLREWMDGIRWLKNNSKTDDVVLAEITAANYIPAYSGNTVYWGQSNTVDYDRKEKEVDSFFAGKMPLTQAELFLKNGRMKYIFFSIQEKEKSGGKDLVDYYPFVKTIYNNPIFAIYTASNLK